MPGLIGAVSTSGAPLPDLRKMMKYLLHEPFYISGAYSNDEAGVRLGWVGLPESFSERMPVWNERREILLLFSGADFSHAGPMDAAGVQAESGGARVMALYEALGSAFVEKLNGWFSGLIVDLRQGAVLIFNDRYGLGRVYWSESAGCFYFASEAKALLAVLPGTRRLETRGVAETIACGSVMQDRTLFSGVSLMPPASIWRFEKLSGLVKERYFKASAWEAQLPLQHEEFYQRLKETFVRIAPRYLNAPAIAMSLTGGLDGRMIMAAAHAAPGALPCYTFNGPYRDCADLRIARRLAHLRQQSHQTISVGANFLSQFPALAEKSVYISDGTMDVTGAVELYVNRIAREIAPVRLTGNYGSEIVRGNVAFRTNRVDSSLFTPEFEKLLVEAEATYREERNCARLSFIAFKQTPWHHYARLSVEQSQLILRTPFLDNELVSLMYRAPADSNESPANVLRLISECDPRLDDAPTDRGLRRNGGIVDSLNRLAIDFSVKAEYAYDYGMPNRLARIDRIFAPLHLERLFLGRHKFYHFRIWYKETLGDYLTETLLNTQALQRGVFRPEAIERMVREHIDGAANWTRELHRALTIELIHRQLLERW